jgi:hypothetical protein
VTGGDYHRYGGRRSSSSCSAATSDCLMTAQVPDSVRIARVDHDLVGIVRLPGMPRATPLQNPQTRSNMNQ